LCLPYKHLKLVDLAAVEGIDKESALMSFSEVYKPISGHRKTSIRFAAQADS